MKTRVAVCPDCDGSLWYVREMGGYDVSYYCSRCKKSFTVPSWKEVDITKVRITIEGA